jgi:putative PLP-dependent aminotransferase (TIGR04422 family)
MDDYQWPEPLNLPNKINESPSSNLEVRRRIETIEGWFRGLVGREAVIFSSGRAAIAAILQVQGFNRSHLIYAPRWSSYCLLETICRKSSPTISIEQPVDAAIIVHKWGQIETFSRTFGGLVIEDSVDNIILKGCRMFPNGGNYEVMSLPKIAASFSGGVAIAANAHLAEQLREIRRDNTRDAIYSAKLKYLAAKRVASEDGVKWQDVEHRTYGLDAFALDNIEQSLPNLEKNRAIIEARISDLRQDTQFSEFLLNKELLRSPPVVPIPTSGLSHVPAGMMVRKFNFAGVADHARFESAVLLPIHFGISDRFFSDMRVNLKAAFVK